MFQPHRRARASMLRVLITLLVAFAALALGASLALAGTGSGSGTRSGLVHPRIVGGDGVDPGEYAARWTATVALVDPRLADPRLGQFCGGTLIAPNRVVTAAHCVFDGFFEKPISPGWVDVLAGSRTLSGSGAQRVHVQSIIVHPDYDPWVGAWDVAVLRLAKPVVGVVPVRPVTSADPLLWGGGLGMAATTATGPWVAGWGQRAEGAPPVDVLHEALVPIIPDSACMDGGAGYGVGYGELFDPQAMICAGRLDTSDPTAGEPNDGVDSCYGDSGGPVIVGDGAGGWRLAGIVSFGLACASRSTYGVYTRVGAVGDWLAGDPPLRPRNLARPTVTGVPKVGAVLTCQPGRWASEQAYTRSYKWVSTFEGGGWASVGSIFGATRRTYTVREQDAGSGIACVETATNSSGGTSKSSRPTSPIEGGPGGPGEEPAATITVDGSACGTRACDVTLHLQSAAGTRGVAVDGWVTGAGASFPAFGALQADGSFRVHVQSLAPGSRYRLRLIGTDRHGEPSAARDVQLRTDAA